MFEFVVGVVVGVILYANYGENIDKFINMKNLIIRKKKKDEE